MKKLTAITIILVLLVFSVCGCQKERTGQGEGTAEGSAETTESGSLAVSEPAESPTENECTYELLTEKYMREIDGAYAEENKLPDSSTTWGMVLLADKYADQWAAVADEYYQKLMEYDREWTNENYLTSDDLHTYISNMKSNWEQYYQIQYENYGGTLRYIYDTGTIVGPLLAGFRYNMQKDWTLFILDICDQLGIQ